MNKHLCTISFEFETDYDVAHLAVVHDNKVVVKALMDRVTELVSDPETLAHDLRVLRTELDGIGTDVSENTEDRL